jgi:hypothetical protein
MTDIAAGAVIDPTSGFRVGDVLGRSFSIFGRNFASFAILSAVAALPYLLYYWTLSGVTTVQRGTPGFNVAAMQSAGGAAGLSVILGLGLNILTQAIIVHAAFQDMRQRPVRIGESFRVGLGRILPILGIMILYGLGVGLGFLLFVVPGIILLLMWYVAIQACVVERLGPLGSLGRSAFLTKGNRWKLFGLVILVGILGGIVSGVVPVVGKLIAGRAGYVIMQYVAQTLVTAFGAILGAVIYRDLRVAKEGIDTDRIASVFD